LSALAIASLQKNGVATGWLLLLQRKDQAAGVEFIDENGGKFGRRINTEKPK
jgi:hypothetical protein